MEKKMNAGLNRRDWMKTTGLAAGALAVGAMKAPAAEPKREASSQQPAKSSVVFQRTIPVRYEVDVFVAGGGPAGTAAAVAARSQGASV
ncbi:MAG: twin-arginine translocation signal domain-containing protein [Verrucomicrobia bacterium]|nr:twin-arginine translocation signal domain-containing protein [Verrucomicrobiota bacterium]